MRSFIEVPIPAGTHETTGRKESPHMRRLRQAHRAATQILERHQPGEPAQYPIVQEASINFTPSAGQETTIYVYRQKTPGENTWSNASLTLHTIEDQDESTTVFSLSENMSVKKHLLKPNIPKYTIYKNGEIVIDYTGQPEELSNVSIADEIVALRKRIPKEWSKQIDIPDYATLVGDPEAGSKLFLALLDATPNLLTQQTRTLEANDTTALLTLVEDAANEPMRVEFTQKQIRERKIQKETWSFDRQRNKYENQLYDDPDKERVITSSTEDTVMEKGIQAMLKYVS